MDSTYVEEFCTTCGTSPCSHPDMGAALALADADRKGRMLVVSLVVNLLLAVVALLCLGGVI